MLEGPAGPVRQADSPGFYNPMFVWKYGPAKQAAKTFITWFVQSGRLEPLYTGRARPALADLQVRHRHRARQEQPPARTRR